MTAPASSPARTRISHVSGRTQKAAANRAQKATPVLIATPRLNHL